jgi:Arc/MetJ-type ribon-helix-helix transcriptional regulator
VGDNVYDESMSKITFRADDDLIRQLEEFDASKSEVMRDALRAYLDENAEPSDTSASPSTDEESLDDIVADRVDALIADRLERAFTPRQPQDINVNISLDGDSAVASDAAEDAVNVDSGTSHTASNDASHAGGERMTDEGGDENADANDSKTCAQCGDTLSQSHVYCPNCGEKSSRRVFCDCGDELRSDWAFCPGCGRRTPAADVLDQGANVDNTR